jgi:hypothetical protein
MPKRIQITPHLSVDELEKRYRHAKDGVERSHYQIIWLLARGHWSEEVAQLTGYSRSWIYELVWGYNRLGVEAIGDKRRQNAGAAPCSMRFSKRSYGKYYKNHQLTGTCGMGRRWRNGWRNFWVVGFTPNEGGSICGRWRCACDVPVLGMSRVTMSFSRSGKKPGAEGSRSSSAVSQ